VLNACQLGDSGNAINGNLSFAAAVSRAGARQVVAALWPVSDSAAALWVPAFYSALTNDSHHDAAEALRAAQLRLRASRAFVHPFFWAGIQTLEQLPLTAAVPTVIAQKVASPTAKVH
jgi:CHAT domain-containing protein